jgi:spermidine/putrescine transport system permease protein
VNKVFKKRSLRKNGSLLKTYGFLVFVFLYFPLFIVLIYSLSPTRTITGMDGVTLRWYQELLHDGALLSAFFHSLIVGVSAVFIALVLGTSGAFFLVKVNFPGKGIFKSMVMLPFLLPGIIMGLTLLIFIRLLDIPLSMFTILLGHVSFTTPLVMFQISGRIIRMGPNYEFAAQDLGANPVQTFWYVTLPMIKTALIGAGLLAFTVSFDEIVISYFLTGTWMTLPVYIYGMMRFGLSPKIYAISALVLFFSLALIILMSRYMGRAGETYKVKKQDKE